MKAVVQQGILLGLLVILGASGCSLSNNDDAELREALLADPSTIMMSSSKNNSLEEIYSECNKTFIITMDYLSELNDTGSFPDETDKTPMCFMRCFLQKNGILTEDDKINKELAISAGWVKNGETIDECLQDMTGSECERAYFLARCVSTRSLVEGRSKESKKR
ncbi:general odorant-binding protein 84a [Topomyia yanbarensis]|uniref:general odorant-binding protein 84a n=1 Tax=Topomyia yanbarensis TaxID=2498891 RepID=UPI00273C1B69|nr:general odorant-binding protein 84a [Topomyia yanbarensis]